MKKLFLFPALLMALMGCSNDNDDQYEEVEGILYIKSPLPVVLDKKDTVRTIFIRTDQGAEHTAKNQVFIPKKNLDTLRSHYPDSTLIHVSAAIVPDRHVVRDILNIKKI